MPKNKFFNLLVFWVTIFFVAGMVELNASAKSDDIAGVTVTNEY